MRNIFTIAAVSVLIVTTAVAETAPSDVAFEDGSVMTSLTGTAGDASAGRKTFMNRKLGNCLACHTNDDMPEQQFHGEVGPPLTGVGDRWEAAELRGIVVNAKKDCPRVSNPKNGEYQLMKKPLAFDMKYLVALMSYFPK